MTRVTSVKPSVKTIALFARPKKPEAIAVARDLIAAFPDQRFLVEPHLGDPLEDLAWSLARVLSFGKDDRRSGVAPREEALRLWQAASGLAINPEALHWWELMMCIKGQAIWNAGVAAWQKSDEPQVIHAYAAWWLRNAQDRAILELMGKL